MRGKRMNSKGKMAVLAVLLVALQALLLVPSGIGAAGENEGSASSEGIAVSYIDSSDERYGIMTVSFADPDDDSFHMTIDNGTRSASISVDQGRIAVPRLSAGNHYVKVECGKDTWNLTLAVGEHEHSWDSGEVTKAATCTGTGVKTYACSCGETKTETIPATGHSWSGWTVVKQATSSEEGLKERICSACGEKQQEAIPVSGHEHSWDSGKVTKEPTCTEAGAMTYTCSCGKTKTEAIPATGHVWSDWTVVTVATEAQEGLKERTCSACGEKESEAMAKIVVIKNEDGTTTKTEEEADGTKVSTTTGTQDGSTKVEKVKEQTDDDGDRISKKSSEVFDSDGKQTSSETEVKVESSDGSAVSTAKADGASKKVEIVTVVDAGSDGSIVTKEQMQVAISVQEKASAELGGSAESKTKTIKVESAASGASVTVEQDAVKAASESGSSLKVASATGSIEVSSQVLSNVSSEETITISIDKAADKDMSDSQKEAVRGGSVIEVKVLTNGKDLGKVLGGNVTISVKHVPAEGKVAVAYYVDDHGSKQRIANTAFNPERGEVSFVTTHCSLYMIVDESPAQESSESNSLLYVCIGAVVVIAVLAAVLIRRRS